MRAPVRKIVDRRMDFRETEDHPHGFIVETLECGHEHIEDIAQGLYGDDDDIEQFARAEAEEEIEDGVKHSHNAKGRRCRQCQQGADDNGKSKVPATADH